MRINDKDGRNLSRLLLMVEDVNCDGNSQVVLSVELEELLVLVESEVSEFVIRVSYVNRVLRAIVVEDQDGSIQHVVHCSSLVAELANFVDEDGLAVAEMVKKWILFHFILMHWRLVPLFQTQV